MADRSARGKTKKPEARTYGKTQKADRFWFAPAAAKKVGQWRLGRGAAATMRGCSSIASNTGAANLQRKTQKADRFWFAPAAAKKAGQSRLRTRRCCNHAGLFVDRPKTPEPRTFNGKTQKADRFWFAPGRIKPNPSIILKGVCQEL
jgi:hypothetical protein